MRLDIYNRYIFQKKRRDESTPAQRRWVGKVLYRMRTDRMTKFFFSILQGCSKQSQT